MAWRNISQPFLWISQPPCLLAHNLFLLWHSLIFTNWEPVISQIYSLIVKASWFQDRFNLGTVFSSKTGVWQWNVTLESICFININFRTGLPDQNELTDHCFTNQARKKKCKFNQTRETYHFDTWFCASIKLVKWSVPWKGSQCIIRFKSYRQKLLLRIDITTKEDLPSLAILFSSLGPFHLKGEWNYQFFVTTATRTPNHFWLSVNEKPNQ